MSAARVGIVAGGGAFPAAVAREAAGRGREIHIFGITGEAEPEIEAFPHTWFRWGEIGRLLAGLRQEACTEVVIIGSVSRPDIASVRFDLGAIRNLPLLLSLMIGGDDSVLSSVVRFFEAKGFTVRGAHEVAPGLVAEKGPLGGVRPSGEDEKDIAQGLAVVRALGALDVGQAAVVTRGHVIAVEAAEGTDQMLMRAAELRQWGRRRGGGRRMGVLVKRPKPRQEMRVDMPAIGPRTVELVAAAGLAGVAVLAGATLMADRDEIRRIADREGIFLAGIEDAGS